MKNNSGGSVPQKTGKKKPKYERGSNSEMQQALNSALQRLGDPIVKFRERRNQIVKRKLPPKEGA